MRVGAVIVAAGRGRRLGAEGPKQFVDLGGEPLLAWSVRAFAGHPDIERVVVTLPAEWAETPPKWLPDGVSVHAGGVARADSVRIGVGALAGEVEVVLVHDGARPFASAGLISRVVEAGRRGPAIPVIGLDDTVKRIDDRGRVIETVPREDLRRVQTPQGFPAKVLAQTHALADAAAWGKHDAAGMTDDAMLCERLGIDVSTVEGDHSNLKITTPRDLSIARWMVESGLIPSR
ncbi:2-C-methyl-D-erythritol 4-phosphate cytidylyltransferase [Candidatus Palauibacter sp.]|uniref:2-C-methyl-D-erythritol 4-phosphate cytidylyltransferase n=1 Tax=Candidatus Palauibacter sp. TaxID=3101350 RepID=UPI003AF240C5